MARRSKRDVSPEPDIPILIPDVPLKDVLDLPKKEELSPNITQYNTARPQEAVRTLREAARNGQHVEIVGWDSDTNSKINLTSSPKHLHGVRAEYFLNEMDKHAGRKLGVEGAAKRLSQELINQTDVIDRGHIDFFQIYVYKK